METGWRAVPKKKGQNLQNLFMGPIQQQPLDSQDIVTSVIQNQKLFLTCLVDLKIIS
jgi:hypothetical protein